METEGTTDFWYELTFDQRNEIEEASLEIVNGEAEDYDTFMEKHR